MYDTTLRLILLVFLSAAACITPLKAQAQTEIITSAKTAIKAGDSKELARHFNSLVELKIQDANMSKANAKDYSKTQAEYILKEFFRDNPPQNFDVIHEGVSKAGNLHYAIGKYICRDRNNKVGSFRVFMKIKQQNGSYVIDAIDFSKDDGTESNN